MRASCLSLWSLNQHHPDSHTNPRWRDVFSACQQRLLYWTKMSSFMASSLPTMSAQAGLEVMKLAIWVNVTWNVPLIGKEASRIWVITHQPKCLGHFRSRFPSPKLIAILESRGVDGFVPNIGFWGKLKLVGRFNPFKKYSSIWIISN